MYATNVFVMPPVRVGLVGTGYAAKLRADTLQSEPRAQLVAVAGRTPEKVATFSQEYQAQGAESWRQLIDRADVDLVIIATINRDHGAIAQYALAAGKHVVVEYPLALDLREAENLVQFAQTQNLLLHVEHIELLGGVHQALRASLPLVGAPFCARYVTLNPQRPAPQKWTYQPDLFGFPLMGALSRLHRLIDVFGQVATVSCQTRLWDAVDDASHFSSCLCTAQLRFQSGLLAEVTYGKGEALWQTQRLLEVQGEKGALVFDGDRGSLIQDGEPTAISVGSRRGLFAKDTQMLLDHLLQGTPLYTTPVASLYTLKVADAARCASGTQQTIHL